MQQLSILTANADQKVNVILTDGSRLGVEMIYRPAVQRWMANITHPLLTTNGIMLCMFPNLLRPWRNLVAFGLCCTTVDGADPFDINDFVNGRAQLYVLNSAEMARFEAALL